MLAKYVTCLSEWDKNGTKEQFMHPWQSLHKEVLQAISSLDLGRHVSSNPPTGDQYVTDSELGLSSHIVSNICNLIMRALFDTNLSSICLGVIHAAIGNPSQIPNIILLQGVGEFKT